MVAEGGKSSRRRASSLDGVGRGAVAVRLLRVGVGTVCRAVGRACAAVCGEVSVLRDEPAVAGYRFGVSA